MRLDQRRLAVSGKVKDLFSGNFRPTPSRLRSAVNPIQVLSASSSAMQRADGHDYYRNLSTYYGFGSNPVASSRFSAGLKFSGAIIPRGTKLRSAYLQLNAAYAGTTGINCYIHVEDVDVAADYGPTPFTPTDVNSRVLHSGSVAWSDSTPVHASVTLPFNLAPLIQPVIDRSGWNPTGSDGVINIIIKGNSSGSSYVSRMYTPLSANVDYRPKLIIEWGDVREDSFEFDVVTLGDSWMAFAGHSGFVRGTTPIPLFTGCSYSKLPAGAAGDSYSFYGIGADMKRGFTARGVLFDELNRYFDTGVVVPRRHEHALGGTTAAAWANPSYTGWSYAPAGTSANDIISSPPTGKVVVFMSLGGNDLINLSKTSGGRIRPENVTNWSSMLSTVNSDISSTLTNIFDLNPDAHVVFLSYTRMRIIDANPPTWRVYPNSNSLNVNQIIWGVPGFGFAGQADYDMQLGVPTSNGSYPSSTEDESTHWRFTAYRQQYSYGIGPPPNQAHYTWSLAAADTNPNFLAFTTWLLPDYPSGTVIDGWKDSFRNITDVNINEYWHRLLLEQQSACDAFPNVHFVDCWDAIGVDTEFSVDPSSLYAQSPNDYWSDWLHLDVLGYSLWTRNAIERAIPEIPFLQPYLPR